jgi:hypothetical protein
VGNAIAELERELAPGERLLWSGQPMPGLRLRAVDAFLMLFGFLWLAFCVGWEIHVLRTPGPMATALALFGLPFFLMGLYMAGGRLFAEAARRRRTSYGITHRRALIVTRGRARHVRSLDLHQLSDVQMTEQRDHSGTLRLITAAPGYARVAIHQQVPIATGEVFEQVPRVREAYATLQQARAALPR